MAICFHRRTTAVVLGSLAALLSGCGDGSGEGTAAAPSSETAEVTDSPSPSAEAVPADWERLEFGVVSVAIPDGWGYVTSTDGELNIVDVDLDGEQLKTMTPEFDEGALVILVDAATVSGGLISAEDAMTSMSLYAEASPEEFTEDELIDVLKDSSESMTEFEVEAFSHPSAPAAVATYTVVEDDVDYRCRDYAVGTATPVLALMCTDPHEPDDRLAESDEIVRTIRVE